MTSRLKTLHHFIEEYPDNPPNKSWDDVDSIEGVVNRLDDELNDLEEGLTNLEMTSQQSFETIAIMINKSRLYVSGMTTLALGSLENVLKEKG